MKLCLLVNDATFQSKTDQAKRDAAIMAQANVASNYVHLLMSCGKDDMLTQLVMFHCGNRVACADYSTFSEGVSHAVMLTFSGRTTAAPQQLSQALTAWQLECTVTIDAILCSAIWLLEIHQHGFGFLGVQGQRYMVSWNALPTAP